MDRIFRHVFTAGLATVMIATACDKTNTYNTVNRIDAHVYLEWGASVEDTKTKMSGYSIKNEDEGYLIYEGRSATEKSISYYFKDGGLKSSLLIVPASSVEFKEIESLLSDYTYLNNLAEARVYLDKDRNMVASIKDIEYDGISCYAVGWSCLQK